MIRYEVSLSEIEKAVDTLAPTWRTRAGNHAGVAPFPALWREIKPVFMEIQHDKCAYCERQLGSKERGKGEFDLEHYRPKSEVKEWRGMGAPSLLGYARLAYHLGNYAVACPSCNRGLKSSHFPIEGVRDTAGDDPSALDKTEKPLLIFPIGDTADDPRSLIRFEGFHPMPVNQDESQRDNRRAQVTIEFFELDNRPDILRERCRYIIALYFTLLAARQGFPLSERALQIFLSDAHPHANCLNCFCELFLEDNTLAMQFAIEAIQYLESVGEFTEWDYLPTAQYAE